MMHPLSFSLFITLSAILTAVYAQGTAPAPSVPTVSGCPAVLSVTAVCNTCVTLACITTAAVTVGCPGDTCPAVPATVFTGYPCESGCEGLGGCQTVYAIVTAAGDQCGTPTGPGSSVESTATVTTVISTDTTTNTVTSTDITTNTVTSTAGTGSSTTDAPSGSQASGTVTSTRSVSTNAARRLSPFRFW